MPARPTACNDANQRHSIAYNVRGCDAYANTYTDCHSDANAHAATDSPTRGRC